MTPNQIYGMVRRNGELNLPPNIAEVALSVPHLHVDSKKLIEYANAASVPTVTFELSGPTVIWTPEWPGEHEASVIMLLPGHELDRSWCRQFGYSDTPHTFYWFAFSEGADCWLNHCAGVGRGQWPVPMSGDTLMQVYRLDGVFSYMDQGYYMMVQQALRIFTLFAVAGLEKNGLAKRIKHKTHESLAFIEHDFPATTQ